MSRSLCFWSGFILAALLGTLWALRQSAQAEFRRAAHEAALRRGAAQLDSTRAALDSARQRVAALAADSSRLAASLLVARQAADAGLDAVRELARTRRDAGDTATAAALEGASGAVQAERAACSLVVLNCEERAANATAAWHTAEAQLASTAALLDTTAVRWRDAERRAQPSFFRDLWRARAVTVPLVAATLYCASRP